MSANQIPEGEQPIHLWNRATTGTACGDFNAPNITSKRDTVTCFDCIAIAQISAPSPSSAPAEKNLQDSLKSGWLNRRLQEAKETMEQFSAPQAVAPAETPHAVDGVELPPLEILEDDEAFAAETTKLMFGRDLLCMNLEQKIAELICRERQLRQALSEKKHWESEYAARDMEAMKARFVLEQHEALGIVVEESSFGATGKQFTTRNARAEKAEAELSALRASTAVPDETERVSDERLRDFSRFTPSRQFHGHGTLISDDVGKIARGLLALRTHTQGHDEPLTYSVRDGRLSVSIGVNTLACATVSEPRDCVTSGIVISDNKQFANDVLRALQEEREDGSTLITDVLDKAGARAYEDGSLGVDYDATEKVRCVCRHLYANHNEEGCDFCGCENPAPPSPTEEN